MKKQDITAFQQIVWGYYNQHARHSLPWRQPEADSTFDPYKIMVSEIMLQQTQVARVIPKYQAFVRAFPNVQSLANAELGEVLRMWQGLGYNRRAKFLWQAAGVIHNELHDAFPDTTSELIKLPGIGVNTAGAIIAYAYNKPVVFLETNVRTVFIHHFFAHQVEISDKELTVIVQAALPKDPTLTRDWYWALMDYGTHVKAEIGNLNKLSKTYTKQSKFHGSKRQIRGQVLRLLAEKPLSYQLLQEIIDDERLDIVLQELAQEQLIKDLKGIYQL